MAEKENGHDPMTHAQNGLYTYDSFSGNSKPSEHRFLWWCAGAHQKLLKKFPSEYSKYAGLGGVILATFILASLSGGYAVHSVFGNPKYAPCPLLINMVTAGKPGIKSNEGFYKYTPGSKDCVVSNRFK